MYRARFCAREGPKWARNMTSKPRSAPKGAGVCHQLRDRLARVDGCAHVLERQALYCYLRASTFLRLAFILDSHSASSPCGA